MRRPAMIKLYRAYREQAERLSDLSELLAREGRATALSGARLPIDEVREVFERRPNHFAAHRGGGRGVSLRCSIPATICSPR